MGDTEVIIHDCVKTLHMKNIQLHTIYLAFFFNNISIFSNTWTRCLPIPSQCNVITELLIASEGLRQDRSRWNIIFLKYNGYRNISVIFTGKLLKSSW